MTHTLPRVLPSPPGKPIPPSDTTAALRDFARGLPAGRPWTPQAARFFTDLFDQLAATWDTGQATGRDEPLRDALSRGGPLPAGVCLEIGSGTGAHTLLLTSAFPRVISLDLSARMLQQAAGRSPTRIRADAARLPIATGCIAAVVAVVAVDMLLFADQIARVLAPGGVLSGSTSSAPTDLSTFPPPPSRPHCPDAGTPPRPKPAGAPGHSCAPPADFSGADRCHSPSTFRARDR